MEDLTGDYSNELIKFLVCSINGWNPFSDEVRQIPSYYWIMALKFNAFINKRKWGDLMEPQAELIGSISNPEVFKEYYKRKNSIEQVKSTGEAKLDDNSSIAFTDAKFDPTKGLVDKDGNIIISKEDFMKNADIDGAVLTDLSM